VHFVDDHGRDTRVTAIAENHGVRQKSREFVIYIHP